MINDTTAQDIVIALEELAGVLKQNRAPVINVNPQGASVVVPPPPKCGYTITIEERDGDGNIKSMTLSPVYE